MFKKFFTIALIIICLTHLLGCGIIRKWKIESELAELNSQKASSQQRLDSLKQKLMSLQSQSNKLTTDFNTNRSNTMTLLKNNPGTVGCIASGTVALSNNNTFSKDVKELGATIGLVCLGAYLFSEDFQKSADNLVSELNLASERAENLQSQINSLKPKIDAETSFWKTEKKTYDNLDKKIKELELELDKLTR